MTHRPHGCSPRWRLGRAAAIALLLVPVACSSSDPPEQASTPPPPPPPCGNLALAATATAQSTFPGYSIDRLHDGDRSTALGGTASWVNADASGPNGFLPNIVTLDLGSPQTLTRVDLYTTAGWEISDYDLQVPAGAGFTTIASVRGNRAQQITSTFNAVTASQLRVVTLRGPDIQPQYTRINELEVTGCTAAATTRITGLVTRYAGDGVPGGVLPGITVEAGGVTTPTDANGGYEINNLPFGTYTVHLSGGGYTFGSAQFQIDHNTVTLSAGSPNAMVNAVGYNRNPIVYVHGFNDGPGQFVSRPSSQLAAAGYAPFFATLDTSLLWTPPFATNVSRVQSAISDAKYRTGQPKVILFAHSMGGLVARTYLETGRYNGDVSQFFSFGTPHLGIPALVSLACLPNQPAVCEMTRPGMVLFNLTHWKRGGVDYHEVGGDAPLWTTKTLFCFKLFGHKHCLSIPWPDTRFRNTFGWFMGLLIVGPDDGLIGTCSSIGEPGSGIDRFVTQEVHTLSEGHRQYFDWDDGGSQSQQAYLNCVNRVLVTGATTTCGTRSLLAWGCTLSGGLIAAAPRSAPSASALFAAPSSAPEVGQRAAPQLGQLLPGQTVSRSVVVEGGATTFALEVQSGTGALSLVDPTGQVIDPAYVASISGGSPSDPDAEISSVIPNEAVIYDSAAGRTQYYFPNARPGMWTVVVRGNSDVPQTGSPFLADVMFDSGFTASFTPASSFLTPGTTASFALQLPAVASAALTVTVTLPDGTTANAAVAPNGAGATATFRVPSQPGYARVRWSVVGQRTDGVAFERGGAEDVQITSTELTWSGVSAEATIGRGLDPGLFQSLVLQTQVTSAFAGTAELSADLVDGAGRVVAHTLQTAALAVGRNAVVLSFDGDDIYGSGLDGPYTLTNVVLIDTRGSALLGATITGAYTTASYRAAMFARSRGAPSVTTTGPYAMLTGDTVVLTARGVDPEGDPLGYAWDLDGNGSYETAGQTVRYTAPASTAASSITVGVRVTDPSGNAATATTTIDISPNREVNLAPGATASASSTFPGYAPSRVNDGDPSTALGGATSWANDAQTVCDTTGCRQQSLLPATLDLDLGATRTLTHVTVTTTDGYPISDYDLSVFDGTGWNVVDRVHGNTQLVRTHNFAPTTASKLRVTGYAGPAIQPGFVRINELQVFGY